MEQDIHFDKTSTAYQHPAETSLGDNVYSHISERILSGRWISGDIIDRKEVAAELDVSLAPVSEALIRLTNEGFLETEPHRHTRVKIVRKEDIRDQLVVRIALERQAVAMAHGQSARQAKPRLLKLAQEVDDFTSADPAAWPAEIAATWPAEIAFHQALVDLADCRGLSASYERVMRRNCFFAINSAHILILLPNSHSHTGYVEGLCTDDAAEADRAMQAHYLAYREVLLQEEINISAEINDDDSCME